METPLFMEEKAKFLRAMDYIARCVNDEEVFDSWLMCGIADGDCAVMTDEELVEYYDDGLESIIGCFLRLMRSAGKDGLYVGRTVGTIED